MAALSSDLTQAARAVHKFTVNGYSATKAMAKHEHVASKRLTVAGYGWEIHYAPCHDAHWHYWVAFKLVFLGVGDDNDAGVVNASLSCRLVDQSTSRGLRFDSPASEEKSESHAFTGANESSPWVLLVKRKELEASRFVVRDSFTVRCTITVLISKNTINSAEPSPDLHLQLGELLRSGRFADVEYSSSSFPAFPSRRTAVLKGGTRKKDGSVRVEIIDDMKADVFRALLHFIYTDTFLELDYWGENNSDALPPRPAVMSLNEAAGRYGLKRLKQICENKLGFDEACSADCAPSGGIDVDTAAATLALAEQHNCSLLKAKCVDFIVRTPANLDVASSTMRNGCVAIAETCREVRLLKIDGYSLTAIGKDARIKSGWNVDGYDWEIHFVPSMWRGGRQEWVQLELIFLSEPRGQGVKASLRCLLVDPSGKLKPHQERSVSQTFRRPRDSAELFLSSRNDLTSLGYLKDDCLTVECTITVLKEFPEPVVTTDPIKEVQVPSSDLHKHLGELLQKETGTDITFVVSGECFAAHKNILAARSPVFMAEFFGHMKEASSGRVVIEDMDAAVFEIMLHFIYTDTVPELNHQQEESATTMATHLLAVADRYGLNRLKLICESKLSGGIVVDTVATTLALAEQHNCSLLKAKCVEFIIRTPGNLDAVLLTDGFKHLEASCPSVRWVGGHDWEIRLRPKDPWVGRRDRPLTLKLVLRSEPCTGSVKAQLSCCLVDLTQKLKPSEMKTVSHKFHKPGDYSPRAVFMARDELKSSGYLTDDSYVVQCAITVLREQPEISAAAGDSQNAAVAPSSELHAHLGTLLENKTGADVTFVVSGESFAAHKAILASRSPVFMAELFGAMKMKASQRVEIKDMEAPVFKAILHFVYTDTVPELDHRDDEEMEAAATAMAQHLLAGADRYGLERLKLICASKLAERIDVDTVSTTLALAEQHDCSHLKAKCVEFIAAGTAENLDAVLATDGYKHLEASCPSVLTDLVKVARGRKK
uniref:BTB domain-containing protein n=1 Tax=Oryza punctata TaxID=4537 RepID=A0A0E0LEH0_ORYPU